eukprot:Rhum_TRINITY_DN14247_c20_g1::Rhum_TRINITY_DN14247_c20_g1_i1::g.77311::m.77311
MEEEKGFQREREREGSSGRRNTESSVCVCMLLVPVLPVLTTLGPLNLLLCHALPGAQTGDLLLVRFAFLADLLVQIPHVRLKGDVVLVLQLSLLVVLVQHTLHLLLQRHDRGILLPDDDVLQVHGVVDRLHVPRKQLVQRRVHGLVRRQDRLDVERAQRLLRHLHSALEVSADQVRQLQVLDAVRDHVRPLLQLLEAEGLRLDRFVLHPAHLDVLVDLRLEEEVVLEQGGEAAAVARVLEAADEAVGAQVLLAVRLVLLVDAVQLLLLRVELVADLEAALAEAVEVRLLALHRVHDLVLVADLLTGELHLRLDLVHQEGEFVLKSLLLRHGKGVADVVLAAAGVLLVRLDVAGDGADAGGLDLEGLNGLLGLAVEELVLLHLLRHGLRAQLLQLQLVLETVDHVEEVLGCHLLAELTEGVHVAGSHHDLQVLNRRLLRLKFVLPPLDQGVQALDLLLLLHYPLPLDLLHVWWCVCLCVSRGQSDGPVPMKYRYCS